MKLKVYFILIFLLSSILTFSQVQKPMSSSDIQLALKKLNTIGSVLYIAAHPDDENTRLISYLANERCYRTGYLSITRGDGGQNLIGKEQGEALGLIRTNELLQARNVDGGEQFFTRANDFGYSKNPEETFNIWNKETVLSDVVWVIRNFKPDVIICRFPTTGEGGHGHHTASAILAEEAFDAAADKTRFPEQLKYVQPWKVKRLYWNTFNFGANNTTSEDQVKLDVGIYNPLIGKGYGEMASESRSMHKSQGFGSARTRGMQIEYFKQLKGETMKGDIFSNINTSWNRYKETTGIETLISKAASKFNAMNPDAILADLNNIYEKISSIQSSDTEVLQWRQKKTEELTKIILACSGAWMEAYADNYSYTPGDSMKVSAVFISRLNENVKLKNAYFNNSEKNKTGILNKADTMVFPFIVPDSITSTNSYWLNQAHTDGLYTVNDQMIIGKPLNEEPFRVKFEFTVLDKTYSIIQPVSYKFTDPVKGELYRKVEVLPKVTVNFNEKSYIINNAQKKRITLTVKANTANVTGKITYSETGLWKLEPGNTELNLKKKNDEQTFYFDLTPPSVDNRSLYIKPTVIIDGKQYSSSMSRIEHDHIPPQFILSNARCKVVSLNITKHKKKIGYIEGAGDAVAECLRQMDYDVTEITDEMLASADLSSFEAIVTGVRAYNTNDRLQVYYEKLMEFIKNGGNLIVQYNTNNRIGPLVARIAPYPFTISRDRVTDENAAMNIIDKTHRMLTGPNAITDDDFKDWIQERGIYFVSEKDAAYKTIFSLNDPGEKPLEGSTIVADYGKGHFIYTGLAFFRQLPAGVPGAYRLFANMIEY